MTDAEDLPDWVNDRAIPDWIKERYKWDASKATSNGSILCSIVKRSCVKKAATSSLADRSATYSRYRIWPGFSGRIARGLQILSADHGPAGNGMLRRRQHRVRDREGKWCHDPALTPWVTNIEWR